MKCPADTSCRDYPSSVTANRCVAGACGSGDQVCPFTARGQGESCGTNLLCDDAGGCTVPKRALGEACSDGGQCASNNCVDSVCCESSCNGPCMNCRAGTGKCDVVPADDASCAVVDCSFSPECITGSVPADIITNRCASIGECKTQADCGSTARPKGTACGTTNQICDGEGFCSDPTVTCGSGW